MLFFGVEYVYGCSVLIVLFRYGNGNWIWYFVIGIKKFVLFRCNWNNIIDPMPGAILRTGKVMVRMLCQNALIMIRDQNKDMYEI